MKQGLSLKNSEHQTLHLISVNTLLWQLVIVCTRGLTILPKYSTDALSWDDQTKYSHSYLWHPLHAGLHTKAEAHPVAPPLLKQYYCWYPISSATCTPCFPVNENRSLFKSWFLSIIMFCSIINYGMLNSYLYLNVLMENKYLN